MGRRMETDPGVVVMGEDVHRLNGGTNGATRGLKDALPRPGARHARSARTPSPASAGGIALDGRFRPVVEFMYADFMWVAADQLFNQIGKARHMFGGDGARAARAAQQGRDGHRLRLAALDGPGRHLRHRAGLADRRAVHARSTTSGLMNTRPALPGPGRRARARRPLQLDRARARSTTSTTACRSARPRSAARARTLTILTYLGMTPLRARGGRGGRQVDAEVIDLRWLDRASIDWDTIEASHHARPTRC